MSPHQTDEQKVCEFLYHGGYSVHVSGSWFGIYVGDKLPKNDSDFLAYELNLLDALQKAHEKYTRKESAS